MFGCLFLPLFFYIQEVHLWGKHNDYNIVIHMSALEDREYSPRICLISFFFFFCLCVCACICACTFHAGFAKGKEIIKMFLGQSDMDSR